MASYICEVCGYIFSEGKEERKWAELPDDWECPVCGSGKGSYKASRKSAETTRVQAPLVHEKRDGTRQDRPTSRCTICITTQDPALRRRFSIPASKQRLVNFFTKTKVELQSLARINGRKDVQELNLSDVFTTSNEVAQNTDINYA